MRIAVVEFSGRGGLVHYTFQLCRALAEEGEEVVLVTDRNYELAPLRHTFPVARILRLWDPKPPGEVATAPLAALGRRLRRGFRALVWYREWLRLMLHLRRLRPDVVLFGDVRFPTDLACFRLLRLAGIPLADICHNVRPFSRGDGREVVRDSALDRWLFERVYRSFRLVFVHGEANRDLLLRSFRVEPGRVAVIRHGNEDLFREVADPAITPDAVRTGLALAPGDRVVLLFGTLTRYKGADVLLESFPGVLESVPGACLVIAGFPMEDVGIGALRGRARELGIEGRVRLVPRYLDSREVCAWMRIAEVAVFPYRAIFQSGALHVPMTFGVPVVATSVGAMPEVVQDGENGLLVPPEDPASLSGAIVRLLSDRDLARRLAGRALADSRERFSWNGIARDVIRALQGAS